MQHSGRLLQGGHGQIPIWKCFALTKQKDMEAIIKLIYTETWKHVSSLSTPSLPLLSPSPPPSLSLNAKRLDIYVNTPPDTHSVQPCLSFLMTFLCGEIGSNCLCAHLNRGSYHLASLSLVKWEMGWDKGCSVENKLQYKYACNSILFFHIWQRKGLSILKCNIKWQFNILQNLVIIFVRRIGNLITRYRSFIYRAGICWSAIFQSLW